MLRLMALGVAVSIALMPQGGAAQRFEYAVGATEGEAHATADRRCRDVGAAARVHMFLHNAAAFECVGPGRAADDRPPGLADGPL